MRKNYMCTRVYVFNCILRTKCTASKPEHFQEAYKVACRRMGQPLYPIVRGIINVRMSIARPIIRATNRCIRGSRIPMNHTSNIELVGKEVQDLDFRKMIEVYRRQQPNCAEAKRIRSGLTVNNCAFTKFWQ